MKNNVTFRYQCLFVGLLFLLSSSMLPINAAEQEVKEEPANGTFEEFANVNFDEIVQNPLVKKALNTCAIADRKAKEECLKQSRKLLSNARKIGNRAAIDFLTADIDYLDSETFSFYEFTKHDITQPRREAAAQFEKNRRQCLAALENVHESLVKRKDDDAAISVRKLIVEIKRRSSVYSNGKSVSLLLYLDAIPQGQPRDVFATDHWVENIQVSPNGRWLVATNERDGWSLWDTTTKKNVSQFEGRKGPFYAGAFSDDGKKYFVGTQNGWLCCYEVESWTLEKAIKSDDLDHAVFTLIPLPDRRILFADSRNGIKRFDFKTEKIETFYEERQPRSFDLDETGNFLVAGFYDGTIAIFDVKTLKVTNQWKHASNEVCAVHFFNNSSLIVSGCYDQTVVIWNAKTGERIANITGFPRLPRQILFNADESLMLVAEIMWWAEGDIGFPCILLDTKTLLPVCSFRVQERTTAAVALPPDGKILYTPRIDPFGVQLWDVPDRASIDKTLEKIQTQYPLPILQ